MANLQEHANPIEYQTSHGDCGQIHNQQADPNGEPVNSTPPNQTGNAPATFVIEARVGVSIAVNSSPPSQTVNSADDSSDTESGTFSFPTGSQTPPDDDGKKETPSKNDNNIFGVNNTPPDDDDGKKETPTKNDNINGITKTPPDDDHKGKYKLENALILGGQIISTMAGVSAKKAKSEMSEEAKFLLYVLAACFFVSLISIVYGFCLFGKAARVVRKIGVVVTGIALVVAVGLQFSKELMVWVTPSVLAVSAPAIIGFAWKY